MLARNAFGIGVDGLRKYGSQAAPAHNPTKITSLLGYSFNGGAPVGTAQYTADGPEALWSAITKPDALNIRYHQVVGSECSLRNNTEIQGVRNYSNVLSAVTKQFKATAAALLRDEKPVGIGGDHSMAAGSVRGAVLAVTIKGILQANSQDTDEAEKDPHLVLVNVGPYRKKEIIRGIKNAVAHGDVNTLCKMLDYLVDENMLPIENYQKFRNRFYVPWFDAHYDINTPTQYGSNSEPYVKAAELSSGGFAIINSPSPSGNFHGMPVAALAGSGPIGIAMLGSRYLSTNPANFAYFGVRDGDYNEEVIVGQLGCHNYPMSYIKKSGISAAIDDFEHRSAERCERETGMLPIKYGQVDIDFLDAEHVPLTGTPVGAGSARNTNAGPGLQETSAALRGMLYVRGYVGADISELASCKVVDSTDRTIESGREMLFSLLNVSDETTKLPVRSGISR